MIGPAAPEPDFPVALFRRIASRIARLVQPAADSAVADHLRRGTSPWMDAVHLLWSGWVFMTPLFSGGYTVRWIVLTLVSYPLFVWLFAMNLLDSRHRAPRYALGMASLSIVLLPWYPAGVSYFIFGCVMLRRCRAGGAWRYLRHVALLNVVFIAVAHTVGYPWQSLIWIPMMAMVMAVVVNVAAINEEKDAQLQLSQDEVRRMAATAERERIGRDLHDLLGHTLSLITLKLELAGKLHDRGDGRARLEISEAEAVARQALAQVRSAVTGIRSNDVAAELAAARLLLECSEVHLHYAPPPPLPESIEPALALVLREAITNIARHAQATRATVALQIQGRTLLLEIADDGRGSSGEEGNGMKGMRERVAALGGTLDVQATRAAGTRVSVKLPLPTPPAGQSAAAAADTTAATPQSGNVSGATA